MQCLAARVASVKLLNEINWNIWDFQFDFNVEANLLKRARKNGLLMNIWERYSPYSAMLRKLFTSLDLFSIYSIWFPLFP